jgi:N-acetylglutamate synthase-like GNAT family acetyltransferase
LVAAIVGDENQVLAYARVVSDGSRVAYLADVIVHPDHRGVGLGQKVVGALMKHRSLRKIDLWLLLTKDAHGLYRKFGFHAMENPERLMVLRAKG